jgi:hypothetical protein
MPSILNRDRQRTNRFFEEHREAMIACNMRGSHLTVEGKALIAQARTELGYSSTTASFDIMSALKKYFNSHKR